MKTLADIGCGPSALYWSLGYIQHIARADWYDCSSDAVSYASEELSRLDPGSLEESYGATIHRLRSLGLIADDLSGAELCEELHTRIRSIARHDILESPLPQAVDVVFANDSLPFVDTMEDLNRTLRHTRDSLLPGGVCAGSYYRRGADTERTESLIRARYDGRLNPDAPQFKKAALGAGFARVDITRFADSDSEEYPEHLVFFLYT
jgi:SAM-dependent methyltransferase